MIKTEKVNIRDPFILPYEGKYYLYGTRSETCWSKAEGFDCYVSEDLENWDGPIEIFHRPDGFEMDQNYWAPECYEMDGKFYLVTTFGSESIKKGIYVLRADRPEGPFEIYSKRLTPDDWTCIDGTVYSKDGRHYLVFSHSFEDGNYNGDIDMIELCSDMTESVGEPVVLFSANTAEWAKPVPFAKAEFGVEEDCYFTDGPFLIEKDKKLFMYWSSWGTNGYAVGEAVSESGEITGPWTQTNRLIFPENGGHGMAFRKFDGELVYTLHYPNDKYKEHPIFINI